MVIDEDEEELFAPLAFACPLLPAVAVAPMPKLTRATISTQGSLICLEAA